MAEGMTSKEFVNKCGELKERVEESKRRRVDCAEPRAASTQASNAILKAMYHTLQAQGELGDIPDYDSDAAPKVVVIGAREATDRLRELQEELSGLWCQWFEAQSEPTDPADPPPVPGVRVRPGMRVRAFGEDGTLYPGTAVAVCPEGCMFRTDEEDGSKLIAAPWNEVSAFADGPEERHEQ